MINVTKTFFPPITEYQHQVQRIWDNQWLTNRGALVLELEDKLTNHLVLQECKMIIMNNGTIPIQIALKLLAKGGEVITTPFSYVATTAAIVWENCTPVFVDIHPEYLTIDETKIEAAITTKTTCILATHVFGNSCALEEIDRIAKKYNLKVIYDAAHCFGVEYKGQSIFEFGDVSTCSFHATKLFHTAEGGAIFCKDEMLFNKLFSRHNFGHNGQLEINELGINAKMSELNAAMGLAVLPYVRQNIDKRRILVDLYKSKLKHPRISFLKIRANTTWNFSYFPIIFRSEDELIRVMEKLEIEKIYPRRYFYPSLNTLPFVDKQFIPISEDIASRIICLPLFDDLTNEQIIKISHLINSQK